MDTDKPVSRQQESEYHRYYGYPLYWPYATAWAYGAMPTVKPQAHIAREQRNLEASQPEARDARSGDMHLRSGKEVIGYQINARDDTLGHVEDFLFESDTWGIHYVVVDTRSWLPGRHVIVPPEQVSAVNWPQREVAIELSREEIERSPRYDPCQPLAGVYDASYQHSGRQPDRR